MSGSEKKVSKNRYNISSTKCVTRKFLEVSCCSGAKNKSKEIVPKKCTARAKLFFLLSRPIVVFSPFSLPSPFFIT